MSCEYDLNGCISDNDGVPVRNLTVNIGDKLYYKGTVHDSVGIGFKVTADNYYLKTTVSSRYTNHRISEGMDGADEEEVTYCLEAIASGETEIAIRHFSDKKDLFVVLEIREPFQKEEEFLYYDADNH